MARRKATRTNILAESTGPTGQRYRLSRTPVGVYRVSRDGVPIVQTTVEAEAREAYLLLTSPPTPRPPPRRKRGGRGGG